MRFKVEANEDFKATYGDRRFGLKKGETTELSGQGFELVNSKFPGVFAVVKEIPETDYDRKLVKRHAELAELEAMKKDELLKEAEKRNVAVPSGALKAEVLESVAEAVKSEPAADTDAEPPLTAASGAINPKAKRGNK
jgi:hypothetical protein